MIAPQHLREPTLSCVRLLFAPLGLFDGLTGRKRKRKRGALGAFHHVAPYPVAFTSPLDGANLELVCSVKCPPQCSVHAMGDVPINRSGFAHGFRPLEGADNPPPTPTQRNLTQRGAVVPSSGFLSALSQQTPVDAQVGAIGVGLGSLRKRRRLPGPLGFLQQGHSG